MDASAYAKAFVQEIGTERVREMHRPGTNEILAATRLCAVEVAAALFRRARAGDLAMEVAQTQATAAIRVTRSIYLVQEITALVASAATRLLATNAISPGDAIHLAGARDLARRRPDLRVIFVCSDEQLLAVAIGEGLETYNPAVE